MQRKTVLSILREATYQCHHVKDLEQMAHMLGQPGLHIKEHNYEENFSKNPTIFIFLNF